jgi:hypothetical protein
MYDETLVAELLRADEEPPIATFNNVEDLLAYLDA